MEYCAFFRQLAYYITAKRRCQAFFQDFSLFVVSFEILFSRRGILVILSTSFAEIPFIYYTGKPEKRLKNRQRWRPQQLHKIKNNSPRVTRHRLSEDSLRNYQRWYTFFCIFNKNNRERLENTKELLSICFAYGIIALSAQPDGQFNRLK